MPPGRFPSTSPELARQISDRHFGVGSDGLICICASERADFRMRMFNADGSEGEMCGNGIRCVGKFVYDKALTDKTTLTVETLAGIKTLELHVSDGAVDSVTVDMGKPVPQEGRTLQIMGRPYEVRPVSMGNPHAVTFLSGVEHLDLAALGPCFERHPSFPDRDQHRVCGGTGPGAAEHAGVGAGERGDPGLRHRSLCLRRGRCPRRKD